MNIRFAFAVSRDNSFENTHFGDAYKFLIYEVADERIYFVESEMNFHQSSGEEKHGDPDKGTRIIRYLKDKRIDVLVSRKFGKNIEMIRKEFLPIQVFGKEPYEVTRCLSKHVDQIKAILKHKEDIYPIIDGREW